MPLPNHMKRSMADGANSEAKRSRYHEEQSKKICGGSDAEEAAKNLLKLSKSDPQRKPNFSSFSPSNGMSKHNEPANAGSIQNTAKKLVIKNFKEKPSMPANFQEVTWEKLQGAVDAIHSSCAIRYSLEELYKAVENMCSYKLATGLYSQLMSRCQKHVRANLAQFLAYPFEIPEKPLFLIEAKFDAQ
ncbi:cullin-4b [Plakobranchus ocellatus]|uniref:Cullin-4b n=1 Tax=Plakobranchus ocellatus TaxID=259542 RepID=A0AAV3YBZ9_9GAST|nr:cullin-4b [Plakobranchus ocellatus]